MLRSPVVGWKSSLFEAGTFPELVGAFRECKPDSLPLRRAGRGGAVMDAADRYCEFRRRRLRPRRRRKQRGIYAKDRPFPSPTNTSRHRGNDLKRTLAAPRRFRVALRILPSRRQRPRLKLSKRDPSVFESMVVIEI